MAPLIQRLLLLGIILLLTNHYVKSSPARIPVKDVKDKETSDKSHTGNELKNSVDQSREDKADVEDDQRQKPGELQDGREQTKEEAQKPKVDNRENSAKTKFARVGGRLDDDQSEYAEDIVRLCRDIPRENNFALLVCLQEKAKIETLLEETGAGTDYRIDHTLYAACEPVVQTVCKDKGKKEGDVMVLSCLMENLPTNNMIPKCEEQLLNLEFFIARDFKLDPEIKRLCKEDAKAVCGASSLDDQESYPNSLVISCLYRNSVLDTQTKVSAKCAAHVQRVMHQRAVDVHLMPEIQIACVQDLGKYCSEKVEKGEEIQCLQEKFDEVGEKCKQAIGNFTEEEGEIEMKDFRFSAEFEKACKKEAQQFCPKVTSKYELVECLSKKIRDAIINENEPDVSEKCRRELRVEEEEESEDVRFDPFTITECMKDIARLCANTSKGQARVLECLRDHRRDLSDFCKKALFQREEEEIENPELDYNLRRPCNKMIKMFCNDVEPSEAFSCLKENKHRPEVDQSCSDMITKRQIRQSQDVRLNPQLMKFCKLDIPKFCKDIPKGEGKNIECLKKNYQCLSEDCQEYTKQLIRQAAKDFRLDTRLVEECKAEIKKFCAGLPPSTVGECLKLHLGSVTTKNCRVEIVRQMREGRIDIQADPMLYKACANDVKRHCSDIPFGKGKVMRCLLVAHDSNPARFDRECPIHLSSRLRMWQLAAEVLPPETIGDINKTRKG